MLGHCPGCWGIAQAMICTRLHAGALSRLLGHCPGHDMNSLACWGIVPAAGALPRPLTLDMFCFVVSRFVCLGWGLCLACLLGGAVWCFGWGCRRLALVGVVGGICFVLWCRVLFVLVVVCLCLACLGPWFYFWVRGEVVGDMLGRAPAMVCSFVLYPLWLKICWCGHCDH